MDEDLKSYIITLDNPRILDLGCGSPSHFFKLHSSGFMLNYTGVDIKDEFLIHYSPLKEESQTRDLDEKNESLLKMYNSFAKLEGVMLDKAKFNKSFNFFLECDVVEFMYEEVNKFDVIVLSYVLDKMDKVKAYRLLQLCLKCLTDKGVIFVSVLTNAYLKIHVPKEGDSLYTDQDFKELLDAITPIFLDMEEGSPIYKFLAHKK